MLRTRNTQKLINFQYTKEIIDPIIFTNFGGQRQI